MKKPIIISGTILILVSCLVVYLNRESNFPRELKDIIPSHGNALHAAILNGGAHPADPQLPSKYFAGASDAVVLSTDKRRLADILNSGLEFARSRVKENPIYSCSLGRIAYFMDDDSYRPLAKSLLEEAAAYGSGVAHYYMIDLADTDSLALFHAREAERLGFIELEDLPNDDLLSEEFFGSASSAYFDTYNYGDFLTACYERDYDYLNAQEFKAKAVLLHIHNYLSSEAILWYTSGEIHLELDHEITQKIEALAANWLAGQPFARALTAMATQDAQRMALSYEEDNVFFRETYSAIVDYLKQE